MSRTKKKKGVGSTGRPANHDETRCPACGCFMEEVDKSTEAGWDYDFECNNTRCRSNKKEKG